MKRFAKRITTMLMVFVLEVGLLPYGNLLISDYSTVTFATDRDFVISEGELYKYTGSGGDIIIPDGISIIGNYAFADNKSITCITIPRSVTNIGYGAFKGCTSLKRINFGAGVVEIAPEAFRACTALNDVFLPDNILSVGGGAFMECTSLKSVGLGSRPIPKGEYYALSLGTYAFADCPTLTEITIPDNTWMGEFAIGFVTAANNAVVFRHEGFVINGGAAAKEYAKNNGFVIGIPYKPVTNDGSEPCIITSDMDDRERNWAVFNNNRSDRLALNFYLSLDGGYMSDYAKYLNYGRIVGTAIFPLIDANVAAKAWEITKGLTNDYDKAVAIHDWVSGNIVYDEDNFNSRTQYMLTDSWPSTASEVLKYRRAVCQGYSNLTSNMMRTVGIPAKVVTGDTVAGSHSWNEVFIEGRWFTLDTTWDADGEWNYGKVTVEPKMSYRWFYEPTLHESPHSGVYDNPDLLNTVIKDSKVIQTAAGVTTIIIPDGTIEIGLGRTGALGLDYSGANAELISSVVIPPSVMTIEDRSLGYFGRDWKYPGTNFVIYGAPGSAAEKYAKDFDFEFMAVDVSHPLPKFAIEEPSMWARDSYIRAKQLDILPYELNFDFDKQITRSEFCFFAIRLYETLLGTLDMPTDFKFVDTFNTDVQKAANLNIITGIDDTHFDPYGELTREQAAVILARLSFALDKPLADADSTFEDNSSISSWATADVGKVQASRVMSGVGGNRFAPQDKYTREQSIVTIMRIWDVVKK